MYEKMESISFCYDNRGLSLRLRNRRAGREERNADTGSNTDGSSRADGNDCANGHTETDGNHEAYGYPDTNHYGGDAFC